MPVIIVRKAIPNLQIALAYRHITALKMDQFANETWIFIDAKDADKAVRWLAEDDDVLWCSNPERLV